MTTDEVLASIVEKEGGFVDHPADRGGPTRYGITAQTLGEWRRLGRPATRAEVKALTLVEAQDLYRARYVRPFERVQFDALRAQLVDVGVLSGVSTAIRLLQGVLRVPVDGIYGERTATALNVMPWRLVNQSLIAARVKLFSDLCEHDDSQRIFLRGWVRRAVSFDV